VFIHQHCENGLSRSMTLTSAIQHKRSSTKMCVKNWKSPIMRD